MHNLGTVIWFEFVRTVKKKSFWLSVLAFPVIIGVVIAVVYFSGVAADSASEKAAREKFSVAVLDESGLIDPGVVDAISAETVTDKQTGIDLVTEGRREAFFYYPTDISKSPVEVYAEDVGLIKNDKYSAVATQLLTASQQDAISPQQQAIIRGQVSTRITTFADGHEMPGFERVIAPGSILVLFYATFVLMAGRMLASTTEEKENRVIEMLLSCVRSRTLVTGKILSLLLVALVQVVAIAVPVGVAVWLARDAINLPSIDLSQLVIDPGTMAVSVAIFILAYLLFTGILVAIGSAVPTAKEAGSFMGVAMFAMFVPLYALQAIISDPSQLLVKIFTYFPLSAPITLLIRNAVGNLSVWEAILGIGILAVSAALALWVAARTFSYGTLEYSRKLSLRELFAPRA
jgi:ABC-2 type transport system permease protein